MPFSINTQNTSRNVQPSSTNSDSSYCSAPSSLGAQVCHVKNAPGHFPPSGLKRLPIGVGNYRHMPIPSTIGRKAYGCKLTASLPRKDLTYGVWPGAIGKMPGTDDQFSKLANEQSEGSSFQIEDINRMLLDNMNK